MQVANPRDNDVSNVILEAPSIALLHLRHGPSSGILRMVQAVPVNFSITQDKETTVVLTLNYDNGDNPHTVTMDVPITFGTDKKQANPVISNEGEK